MLLGYAPAEPKRLFRLGDARMSFLACARSACTSRSSWHPTTEPRAGSSGSGPTRWSTSASSARSRTTTRSRSGRAAAGKLDLVLRDVGWKDGKPSVSAWIPDGIELQVLGARGFHIDEIGLATTTHGASYLKLSASYQVGGAREHDRPARVAAAPARQRHLAPRPADPASRIPTTRTRRRSRSTASRSRSRPPTARTSRAAAGCATRSSTATASASSASGSASSSRPARPSSSSPARSSRARSRATSGRIEYLLAGVTLGPIPLGSFTAAPRQHPRRAELRAASCRPRAASSRTCASSTGTARSRPGSSCRRAACWAPGSRSPTAGRSASGCGSVSPTRA